MQKVSASQTPDKCLSYKQNSKRRHSAKKNRVFNGMDHTHRKDCHYKQAILKLSLFLRKTVVKTQHVSFNKMNMHTNCGIPL